jgi:hypothetical protein
MRLKKRMLKKIAATYEERLSKLKEIFNDRASYVLDDYLEKTVEKFNMKTRGMIYETSNPFAAIKMFYSDLKTMTTNDVLIAEEIDVKGKSEGEKIHALMTVEIDPKFNFNEFLKYFGKSRFWTNGTYRQWASIPVSITLAPYDENYDPSSEHIIFSYDGGISVMCESRDSAIGDYSREDRRGKDFFVINAGIPSQARLLVSNQGDIPDVEFDEKAWEESLKKDREKKESEEMRKRLYQPQKKRKFWDDPNDEWPSW